MARLRFHLLLFVSLFAALAVARVQTPPFEDEILRFEAQDKVSPPAKGQVSLFVGSSSIRKWVTLKDDFPEYSVINRGFGGSQIPDSVRNAYRIVTPYEPKAIVFYAGTNDLAAGSTPEKVLADYRAFVDKVRARMPEVPIDFISIAPALSRWKNAANIRKANELVSAYSASGSKLFFTNIFPLMLDSTGNPRPELFVSDHLHMTPAGYAIWTPAVHKTLREMLPNG